MLKVVWEMYLSQVQLLMKIVFGLKSHQLTKKEQSFKNFEELIKESLEAVKQHIIYCDAKL